MKIAVTSQNFRTVTPHAGRTRRFLVFETQPGEAPVEVDRLDLPAELSMHEFRGHGPHPLDAVDVVISQSFGNEFARRMAKRGIAVAATEACEPRDAAKGYVQAARDGLVGEPVLERLGSWGGHGPGHGRAHGFGHGHAHGHGRRGGCGHGCREGGAG